MIISNLKKIVNGLLEIIRQPVMRILPGQIAFFLVLSIFPLLTLIGVIASFFSISVDTLIAIINDAMPIEVTNLLVQFIEGKGFDTNVGIFMILGFYLASNGTHSIILASNMLYKIDGNDFLKRRIKSFFLIFILLLLFIFLLAFLAFGNDIVAQGIGMIESTKISNMIYTMFVCLKWPFAMFIIYFNIKLIYTIAPDVKVQSKNTTKGALFTTISWTIVTAIYSYYVSNFTNYDIFYGSLSNIIILMIWIYFLSYILVIGIAINVNKYEYNLKEGKK